MQEDFVNHNSGPTASDEYFGTCSRKGRGRGMARRSLDQIDAMHALTEAAQPITGRMGHRLLLSDWQPA